MASAISSYRKVDRLKVAISSSDPPGSLTFAVTLSIEARNAFRSTRPGRTESRSQMTVGPKRWPVLPGTRSAISSPPLTFVDDFLVAGKAATQMAGARLGLATLAPSRTALVAWGIITLMSAWGETGVI